MFEYSRYIAPFKTDEGNSPIYSTRARKCSSENLAHTFGKESAYTIGLVLLGIVFWPMLGFGESVPVDTEDDSDTDYEVL